MPPFRIDAMQPADWPRVQAIYEAGMRGGTATFETESPTWERFDADHFPAPRLVARDASSGEVAGWAVLSPVSRRQCYRGVAEVTIYVDSAYQGRGLGSMLLEALIDASEQAGFWTLQAVVFAANAISIRLHRKHGFRVVGHRERIAQRDGAWIDTVLLERRSRRAGRPPST